MRFPKSFCRSIAFYTLLRHTLQVSVSLYGGATHPQNSITCLNLLPGQCCLPRSGQWSMLRNAQMVTFDSLAGNHIAAVWSRRGQVSHTPGYIGICSGVVLASRGGQGYGPGAADAVRLRGRALTPWAIPGPRGRVTLSCLLFCRRTPGWWIGWLPMVALT